jgi:hypothetical protein
VGKIADAYVEVAADDTKFKAQVANLGKEIDAGMQRSKGAASRALLDVSRGVQDFASAGIMGIVNNVEGIARSTATAMGKSAQMAAGIAGGLTLVAVGIQVASPLLRQLSEETRKFFGYWVSGSDTVRNSVTGMMDGGSGLRAMSEELKKQSEFLQNRSDEVGGWNVDFVSRAMGLKGIDEKALENNQRRAIEASALMSQAFEKAAQAAFHLEAAQRGAAAQFNRTTGQKDAGRLNQELFQAAVDKMGGGDNLRTKIESEARRQLGMNKSQSRELYGRFSMGDVPATQQVERILNLTAERAKIMAEDFEKATGAAAEIAKIENDRIEKDKKSAEQARSAQVSQMDRQTQQAARDLVTLPDQEEKARARLAEFESDRADKMRRSFMFNSISEARDKLFTAAVDNKQDVLTASKMQGEIDKVVKAIEKLNVKWDMK